MLTSSLVIGTLVIATEMLSAPLANGSVIATERERERERERDVNNNLT